MARDRRALAPTVAALMQLGPVGDSSYMKCQELPFKQVFDMMSADKSTVMARQKALLEARYDLSDQPHPTATMTLGKPSRPASASSCPTA